MNKTLLLLVTALLTAGPLSAQQLPTDPNVTVGKLANGLTYYIRENHKPEHRAELRLAVNAGSVLEEENQRGLAHVVEHMAFNGTTHFKKQDLVHYLESIGMRFGADLNAYTTFDETVYMLTVPTDTGKALDQGVQILEDWAHGQVFDSTEIDKERGVVIEEWRLGRGADERMRAKYLPVLFANSRYAERNPIGTKENLDTFKHQDLVRFYRKWYRPDLMSVIAVGDFDKAHVEQLIKDRFGSWTNPDATPRPLYPVPDQDSTRVVITTDKEATVAQVSLYHMLPPDTAKTVADYRASLVQALFGAMLNARLNELTQQPNPPFIGASAGMGSLVRAKNTFALSAGTKDDGILPGFQAVLTEAQRAERFGFTNTELDRAKENLLRGYEQAYAERDKTESGNYADEYINAFLEGEAFPGIANEYDLVKQLLPQISVDAVDSLVHEWLGDRNRVVVVQAPEKPTVKIPTEQQLRDVFTTVAAEQLKPYEDKVAGTTLVPNPPAPGRITAESRDSATGVVRWQLSNGVRVLLKPTDFQADQVLLRAYSPGGTSLVSDSNFVSAELATTVIGLSGIGDFDVIQLQKALAGKAVEVSPYIDDRDEGFTAQASSKDLETMFQLIYLDATAPRRDTTAFQSLRTRLVALLENQSADPASAFHDTLDAVLSQHNFRSRPFTVALLPEIRLDSALSVYRDRFKDASDFTFVIVGSFSLDSIKPLVLQYLGGLPAAGRKEVARDVGIRPPRGVVQRVVKKGVEPKSTTQLVFTGPFSFTPTSRLALSLMLDILEIRLRDVLREDMSGTYGVDVGFSTQREPVPQYSIGISFGADPARLDSLTRTVFRQIDLLKTKGVTAAEIAKVKETQRREWETNVKRNEYWVGQIASRDEAHEKLADASNFPARLQQITAAQINAAAALLRKDNYVRVSLLPEK